jgi:GTPase SAR1 family protein
VVDRAMRAQDTPMVRKLLRERKCRAAKQSVKVLVLGDDGVGKSSLICTLISNHFSEENEMPDVYTDVSIPENEIWDNKVKVTIMDSSQNTSAEELKMKVVYFTCQSL